MAHSVKHPTLDFGSGHDPRVVTFSPSLGSVVGMESASNSFSPSVLLSLPLFASYPFIYFEIYI